MINLTTTNVSNIQMSKTDTIFFFIVLVGFVFIAWIKCRIE